MRPISRRRALQLGGLGVLRAAVGGAGLAWPREDPLAPGRVSNCPSRRRCAAWTACSGYGSRRRRPAGRSRPTGDVYGYNRSLPGPTLRLRPGDALQVQLVNRLDRPTNLHVHDWYVSPEGTGDNIFVAVQPGESFDSDYRLPYHHRPGDTGTTPITTGWSPTRCSAPLRRDRGGGSRGTPGRPGTGTGRLRHHSRRRWAPATALDDGPHGGSGGRTRPRQRAGAAHVTARPGERERWRIVNACASRYVRLRLDGQRLDLLGLDSGRYADPAASRGRAGHRQPRRPARHRGWWRQQPEAWASTAAGWEV